MEKSNSVAPPQSPADPILLSSLAHFWCLIEPLLKAAAPKSVCEIGIGKGEFTRVLLDFCARNDCRYCGIDPAAHPALIQNLKVDGNAQFFQRPSLSALTGLLAQDVYFIDGDHNYHTVINELKLVLHRENHWPLVILHDVGWPWGRRDHYCSPESIPQAFRHPYSTTLGVLPGRAELGPGGFSGEASDYKYGSASHDGGPRNGVLTAVEDFLQQTGCKEWKFLFVPSIFGLGILCAPEKCARGVAAEFLRLERTVAPLRPFLELLERNRIELFLTYLRHISELNAIHDDYSKLAHAYGDLDKHARALLEHSDALLASYRALEAYTHGMEAYSRGLEKTCDELRQKAQV